MKRNFNHVLNRNKGIEIQDQSAHYNRHESPPGVELWEEYYDILFYDYIIWKEMEARSMSIMLKQVLWKQD